MQFPELSQPARVDNLLQTIDTDTIRSEFLKNLSQQKRDLFEKEQNHFIYKNIQVDDKIDYKNLSINLRVDNGNFGEVFYGIYTYTSQNGTESRQIPVAIKKLKINTDESKKELKKEADIMRPLNNPHIIKYMGMSSDMNKDLLIVLEYAKLGPLHKYLKNNQEVRMFSIAKICYQIAIGMEYLLSKGIVHRDLAARNVLLVKEDEAKVSDFGLSRLMNMNQYYQTNLRNNKWPIKWLSPETMNKGNFLKS